MIIRALKDPRISRETAVMAVKISKDLAHAKVYVSVYGDERAEADTLAGLRSAAGFIKRELGQRVDLRAMPELGFVADHSVAYGAHINKIIQDLGISSTPYTKAVDEAADELDVDASDVQDDAVDES